MILAVDAQYAGEGQTTGMMAGVSCVSWTDKTVKEAHAFEVSNVAPYEPGAFYKRELPCIMSLLGRLKTQPDIIIVAGYVDTSPTHPGLGRHLFDALDGKVIVVGVAKTPFYGAAHVEVIRGDSKKPLYVTAAGMDPQEAAGFIKQMSGKYRIPDLLKTVDSLARQH